LWAGVSGTNNPCPTGWRIATKAEWLAFINQNLTFSENTNKPFLSPLKLPSSEGRDRNTGNLGRDNTNNMYWMNESTTGSPYSINFYSSSWAQGGGGAAYGAAVRCVED
jgi:hypothetical protein